MRYPRYTVYHSGVYRIVHLATGWAYIGHSGDIEYRWNYHRCKLENQHHRNPLFQLLWNSEGENGFAFEILEQIEFGQAQENLERVYLEKRFTACGWHELNTTPTQMSNPIVVAMMAEATRTKEATE